jgi:hypothetical protein
MVKALTYGKTDPNMLANFKMTTGTVTDKWLGMMDDCIKEDGWMEFKKMLQ